MVDYKNSHKNMNPGTVKTPIFRKQAMLVKSLFLYRGAFITQKD
jgi:hypothetical protein